MMFDALTLIFIFIFGSAVGSFLNVVAYRSVHGGSIFFGRSKCPHCKHELAVKDLVPLLSFVFLKGKCTYCGKKISWQYPAVELSTAVLFSVAFIVTKSSFQGPTLSLELFGFLYILFAVSVLITIFITDLKDGLIPDKIILPSLGIALIFKLSLAYLDSLKPLKLIDSPTLSFSQIGWDGLAGLSGGLLFLIIVLVSKGKGMGGGDIKFAAFLGFALGFAKLSVALFLAFLTGAAAALILILVGKKRFGQTVPFGPFLSLGAAIALLWGQQILDWYLRLNP